MSLEQAIKDLQAAVEANTAAVLKAGGAPAATGKGTATGKGAGKEDKAAAYTPKHTKEEMLTALTEMKEALGLPETKKLIKEVGKKDKMGEIEDPETIDKVYDAAKSAMDAAANKGGDDGL